MTVLDLRNAAVPVDLPCPPWCDGSHAEDQTDELFALRFHVRQTTPSDRSASAMLSASDLWTPGSEWTREDAKVTLWLGGDQLIIGQHSKTLLKLIDRLSVELGELVRANLVAALAVAK